MKRSEAATAHPYSDSKGSYGCFATTISVTYHTFHQNLNQRWHGIKRNTGYCGMLKAMTGKVLLYIVAFVLLFESLKFSMFLWLLRS